MKTCKSCGAQIADEAVICRECGETQPLNTHSTDNSPFSMPYLHTQTSLHSENSKPEKNVDTGNKQIDHNNSDDATYNNKKISIDQITDPRERAFAKRDKRNKLIRIVALIIACLIIISVAAYFLMRSKGYHRALDKYIDGFTESGGSRYLSIVPELYLINAESLYDLKRPDLKSKTNSYLEYVESQYEADFGSGLSFTYKITSERTVDDSASLDTLENSILSNYSTDINISEAAYVNIRLTTKGSITQSTENRTLTFYKYDGKWYSMDAMEDIKFACENAGYQIW